ncbi:UDP-2,4-diacetamido-2,4,6-trideoxy-beta-L-altropyranose hydrolase [Blastopirellula marina]|uniref:UDP-2,4-diacetamido-2,4, 6-trideoxy-beta-L-altropyranose hydrolase n=1 Tax=Blastopirellula marina TaxID=124 RepID=A0A2S8G2W7_9BACT|nr:MULTISPECIES: UDP-2,4-diacetamido-2,4,6-trideoxy-beta-L-altropyranose hydrolase [Pirellulaceae]PQO38795.1 UDP-2,4-diacetamido-2,4,6-trideoxy-beta-L-altropyranose hydrolase [Blastopirellula marina]RCS55103.1 UDP-2,4-diacetamido-2,4,6-trideoxy-beta-L-altropyranose hydrolase [Bremerella cremea]
MLLIRADASVSMGTGHIMRCLALAQAWRGQIGPVKFVSSEMPNRLIDRLKNESFEVIMNDAAAGSKEDLQHLKTLIDDEKAVRVVVDGYQFDDSYQQGLADHNCRVLFFDDYGHCSHYEADWILNQNLGADPALYDNRGGRTKLLLGSAYVLLRQEFLGLGVKSRPRRKQIENILITLGGSDAHNLTLPVLFALKQIAEKTMDVKVLLGPGNPHRSSIDDVLSEFPCSIEILDNVSNMAPTLSWTDIAICGGGSTNWEMAYFGIPRIVLIQADNQLLACQSLMMAGCASILDARHTFDEFQLINELRLLLTSTSLIQQMSHANQNIVDGHGVNRVLLEIAPDGSSSHN